MEAKFTNFTKESNWVSGTVGACTFRAKLFDEGSKFGIRKGRVSKLSVVLNGKCVINFDRGWDIKVPAELKEEFKAIMSLCKNAPKRFI